MYGKEDYLKPSVSTLEHRWAALRTENDKLRKKNKKLRKELGLLFEYEEKLREAREQIEYMGDPTAPENGE